MRHQHLGALVLAAFLGWSAASAGCTTDLDTSPTPGDPGTDEQPGTDPGIQISPDTCSASSASSVYSPYRASGTYPSGTVAQYPWVGSGTSGYPDGDEDFRGYSGLPATIECSTNKAQRKYMDVTDGCFQAVAVGSYARGQVDPGSSHLFRALSLGYASPDSSHPVKWTDQGMEYRFYYSNQVGNNGYPGFKAFLRYRTEYDLYVASWRMDGVVQIQRKLCGTYSWLKVINNYGKPAPNTWHTLRFTAVGDRLRLYLDGRLAIDVTDSALTWGTAGMRIDSMDGAYIDDWKVFAP